MEELAKLLGLVAEENKEQAQKFADAVKSTISGLDAKVNEQERLKIDAITSRDDAKSKLKSIATGLGADVENVVEAIDAIKNKKAGNDDVKDLEIVKLKEEITTLTATLTDTQVKTSKELMAMGLKTEIAKALPKHNAKTAGYDYITQAVEAKAKYEDGKVVFKNADGTSLRIDGKDATVDDMVKQMFDAEKQANESMFFNIGVQEQGGDGKGGKTVKGDFVP
jgi:hypothetical protein